MDVSPRQRDKSGILPCATGGEFIFAQGVLGRRFLELGDGSGSVEVAASCSGFSERSRCQEWTVADGLVCYISSSGLCRQEKFFAARFESAVQRLRQPR